MQQIYSINPVVCSQPEFIEAYNSDIESIALMSECMTPVRFRNLIDENVTFNKIVFINNEGKEIAYKLGNYESWDEEIFPPVQSVNLDNFEKDDIKKVHKLIKGDPMEYGMG